MSTRDSDRTIEIDPDGTLRVEASCGKVDLDPGSGQVFLHAANGQVIVHAGDGQVIVNTVGKGQLIRNP